MAFIPDYRVSLAERIFPGSDLSEQISTAGFEASGTGNMKFALNGALTIGTLDGANVEIVERVGRENAFIFGLTAEEVEAKTASGYRPREVYESSPRLRRVLDFVSSGAFSPEDSGLFRPLVEGLLHHDPYMVLADFDAYVAAQAQVDEAWRDDDGVDAQGDPERGALRLVQQRPLRQGIRGPDLEAAGQRAKDHQRLLSAAGGSLTPPIGTWLDAEGPSSKVAEEGLFAWIRPCPSTPRHLSRRGGMSTEIGL